jgi:ABC-type Na+ efflux pump permease subunit
LCIFPLSANAHGEGFMLLFVAALAAAGGLVFGSIAGSVKNVQKIPFPLWFVLYIFIGGLVSWVVSGDVEGAILFLTFGGIAGFLPFLFVFYAAKWISTQLAMKFESRKQ